MPVWIEEAHAHVQRLTSVAKMATLLEECITEEHPCLVRVLWEKVQFHKEMFPVH
jgi:hypothetical protein